MQIEDIYINPIHKAANEKFLAKSYIYTIDLGFKSCIYTLKVVIVLDIYDINMLSFAGLF